VSVSLYGRNFTSDSKVRVNMKAKPRAVTFVDADLLKVDLRTEDLVGVGSVSLENVNGDKASNTVVVPVVAWASLNVFGLHARITRGAALAARHRRGPRQLFACHKSLTDFIETGRSRRAGIGGT
jgi:hypothetical protein